MQSVGAAVADLGFGYDLADRVVEMTYPSGRVTAVQTKAAASDPLWTVVASGMAYEPFAALTQANFGNGLSLAVDWGNDGRLASRRLYQTSGGANLSQLSYAYEQ